MVPSAGFLLLSLIASIDSKLNAGDFVILCPSLTPRVLVERSIAAGGMQKLWVAGVEIEVELVIVGPLTDLVGKGKREISDTSSGSSLVYIDGHKDKWGTAGATFRRNGQQASILTSSHVLCPAGERAEPNVPVRNEKDDIIGFVLECSPKLCGDAQSNVYEYGIASYKGEGLTLSQPRLLNIQQSQVFKVGAKTGVTVGSVYCRNAIVERRCRDGNKAIYWNQIIIESSEEKFCDHGDSGAIVLNPQGDRLALLFLKSTKPGLNLCVAAPIPPGLTLE
jgi:hypothetical protein